MFLKGDLLKIFMTDKVTMYKSVSEPFFMESAEEGLDLNTLRYRGRGESVYSDGRQVLVRSCHDALVSCHNHGGERGVLLVRRDADPARGYLWSLGGFFDRGVPTNESLASRIKGESGFDVDENSFNVLGHVRAMWATTPNKEAVAKGLPLGIDDTGLLFYVERSGGELNLDRLHDRPLIVTPQIYESEVRTKLHPYIMEGMDRVFSNFF